MTVIPFRRPGEADASPDLLRYKLGGPDTPFSELPEREILQAVVNDNKDGCFDRWRSSDLHPVCPCNFAPGPRAEEICLQAFSRFANVEVTNWLNAKQIYWLQLALAYHPWEGKPFAELEHARERIVTAVCI